jgi:hypothetical protein
MYATDIQQADLALYPALQCLRRRRLTRQRSKRQLLCNFRSKTPSSQAAFRTERRDSNDDVPGFLKRRAFWLGVRGKQRVEPSLDRLLLDLHTSRGDRRSERLERRGVIGISLQLRLGPTVQRQARHRPRQRTRATTRGATEAIRPLKRDALAVITHEGLQAL